MRHLKKTGTISLQTSLGKYIAALIMCFTLFFLTGVNFFVYGNAQNNIEQCQKKSTAQDIPTGEKSSNIGSNLNLQEEYVHEFHLPSAGIAAGNRAQYALHNESEYALVHFELIAPPPDL